MITNGRGIDLACDGHFPTCDAFPTTCDGHFPTCDGLRTTCDGLRTTCDGLRTTCDAKNLDFLAKMAVYEGGLEIANGQKATVVVNWQGGGRETFKEKLKPYLQTGEWSE